MIHVSYDCELLALIVHVGPGVKCGLADRTCGPATGKNAAANPNINPNPNTNPKHKP